jgi:hypothetical protein
MPFEARYEPTKLRLGIVLSVVLFVAGVLAAYAGVWMGWILGAFVLWTLANQLRRYHRDEPVITIDDAGATDHRVPRAVPWDAVESMRTVNRRVVGVKVPLLELVPTDAGVGRDGKALAAAVLRGDIAFADARDDTRVMFDLRHLDVSPEQVLAAAREHRR